MTSEITTIMHFTAFISSEEFDQRAAELEVLTSFLQSDPVANFRISMEQTARIKSSEINCNSIPILKRLVWQPSSIHVKPFTGRV